MKTLERFSLLVLAFCLAAFIASAGMSPPSNIISGTTKPPPLSDPSAPVLISAVGITTNQMQVTWQAGAVTPSNGVQVGFYVQRASSNMVFATILSVTNSTNSQLLFTDTGLQPSTTYWYRIIAWN